jgi:hypothetical protein
MSMPGNPGLIFTCSSTGTLLVWNGSAKAFQSLATAGVTEQVKDVIQELVESGIFKKDGTLIYIFNGDVRSQGYDQGNSGYNLETNGNENLATNVSNWTNKTTV